MNPKIREALRLAATDPGAAYDKLASEVSAHKYKALLARRFTNTEMGEHDAPFTLMSWLDNNTETADANDIAAMFALEPGESYTTGGGAVGRITTTRVR